MIFAKTRQQRVTPTVTAGAYSAGNVLGGAQTIGPVANGGSNGCLKNVSIVDRGNQKPAITLLFFSAPLAGTAADKGAPSFTAADELAFVFKVEIATTDWTTAGGVAFCTKEVYLPFVGDPTRQLYVVPVVSGTPTPVSTTDYTFTYGMRLD